MPNAAFLLTRRHLDCLLSQCKQSLPHIPVTGNLYGFYRICAISTDPARRFGRLDTWHFRLSASMAPRIRSGHHGKTTPPGAQFGLQGQGGIGGQQGREDADRTGPAV